MSELQQPDMSVFAEFLKSCSVMELIGLQNESRQVDDKPTLNCVMEELKRRQSGGKQQPLPSADVPATEGQSFELTLSEVID